MEAPPPPWADRGALAAHAKEFYDQAPTARAQQRFEFAPAWLDQEVVRLLAGDGVLICDYCESPSVSLRTGEPQGPVEPAHYRPPDGVTDPEQRIDDPDRYWWLAYEFDNLLLACEDCRRRKGHRFPIAGPAGAAPATPAQLDASERPLLVNPRTVTSSPFAYAPNGEVAGVSEEGGQTVAIVQLNRDWLVQARQQAYQETHAAFVANPVHGDDVLPADYRSIRRQAATDALLTITKHADSGPGSPDLADFDVEAAEASHKRRDDAIAAQQVVRERTDVANLSNATSATLVTSRAITRVEIHNFKILDDLDLQLTGAPGEWRMLLGENGAGKSTILQAVALTLIDAEYRASLPIDPRIFVRRRCKSGWVRVTLAELSTPVELHFSVSSDQWTGSADAPSCQVLAYGATRLLPRAGAMADDMSDIARVGNLFNPFVALRDAERWLLEQCHGGAKGRRTFDAAALMLQDLLGTRADAQLRVIKEGRQDQVQIREDGIWKPLIQLSDGYQAVTALGIDMMSVLQGLWPEMRLAEGVVLIDELGSHIHPRWQMQMVAALRKTFPRLQFLVSTHNPLCLRGLHTGEVVLMRRTARGRVVALTDLPEVEGLRVDQLLTSPYFGLSSTLDDDMAQKFDRYYGLLAQEERTPEEEQELAALEGELAQYERLGDTPAQQEVYRAVNQLLVDTADELSGVRGQRLPAAAQQEVVDILDRLDQERATTGRRRRTPPDSAPPILS